MINDDGRRRWAMTASVLRCVG